MSTPLTSVRHWITDRGGRAADRLRVSLWSIAQLAVGAGLAWQLAVTVLGHAAPFFAPIAALVCLGLAASHRVRRVAELAVGVTVGVALGELVAQIIGRGAWQLALVVGVALVVARTLDDGGLIAIQAALQAILVLAIPASEAASVARWADAMIGGAVALVIAVLTPPDPRRAADHQARAATNALADVMRTTASAVRARDADSAGRALATARATQGVIDAWQDAVATGEEIARVSPLRRGRAADMAVRRRALTGMDRAIRNTRVLVRRIAGSLDDGHEVPAPVAGALEDLAELLGVVDGTLGARPQPELVEAIDGFVRRLDVEHAGAGTWVGSAVVAQLRAVVVDVLTATGVQPREARRKLPDPGSPPPAGESA